MEPTDLSRLERRLRREYEFARLKQALLGFLPMLLLVVVAALVGARVTVAVPAGALLFVGGVVALWYGREPSRGVLPGALAGGAALVLALCAKHVAHSCRGDQCYSWCVPACVMGGLLAGAIVSLVAVRQHRAIGYWLSASGIALLTGAIGCSCAGYAGIFGFVAGFAVGIVVVLGKSSFQRQPNQPG